MFGGILKEDVPDAIKKHQLQSMERKFSGGAMPQKFELIDEAKG